MVLEDKLKAEWTWDWTAVLPAIEAMQIQHQICWQGTGEEMEEEEAFINTTCFYINRLFLSLPVIHPLLDSHTFIHAWLNILPCYSELLLKNKAEIFRLILKVCGNISRQLLNQRNSSNKWTQIFFPYWHISVITLIVEQLSNFHLHDSFLGIPFRHKPGYHSHHDEPASLRSSLVTEICSGEEW